MQRSHYLAVFLTCTLVADVSGATRKRLWTIDVSRLVGETADIVWGLAISPDQTRLAIGVGPGTLPISHAGRSHVVVVSIAQPNNLLQRFDIDGRLLPGPWNLAWSPSGQRLRAGSRVFGMDGKATCEFSENFEFGGFLSEDRMVVFDRLYHGPTNIQVRSADCSIEESWQGGRNASVVATWPQTGLVLLSGADVDIVRCPGHTPVRHERWESTGSPSDAVLADSGRIFCSSVTARATRPYQEAHAVCWDIASGEKTVEDRNMTVTDLPSYWGTAEEWVVSDAYKLRCHEGKFWQFMDMDGCFSDLTRRVIWNARTGKEDLSWRPPMQKIERPKASPNYLTEPSAVALSAKREFLAEGGAGAVTVYRLQ